ncbi:helix-turn-helix domain-containing protein [Hymenobacter elongatus]|uniref:XRE family transcriptional regulator n=1 Tax=Hymenobacter elongatus TaxID=877208 RepID=A0A4Z0PFG8_9BACT|nr:helix-turn-helix transcriptional regulator [Hymenobacter elongatus]TGE13888.1 XRE family transcriptional regulator [Hymenobacter elongatus]
MTTSSLPTVSLTAAVRAHLGLTVRQLARYLGVSGPFVAHVESGRRGLPPALVSRLLTLSRLLPPPLGQGLPAAAVLPVYDPLTALPPPELLLAELPDTAAPAPEALRRRLRDCRLQLLTQGSRLAQLQARAATLVRRRHGLAQLRAAPLPADPTEAAHYTRWLGELATDLAVADPDPAAAAATRHLLAAHVTGLRAEVAALAAP